MEIKTNIQTNSSGSPVLKVEISHRRVDWLGKKLTVKIERSMMSKVDGGQTQTDTILTLDHHVKSLNQIIEIPFAKIRSYDFVGRKIGHHTQTLHLSRRWLS